MMQPNFRGSAAAVVAGLALVAGSAGSFSAQSGATASLALDAPLNLRLDRNEAHRYALPLVAGQYARVRVEQQGIDVIVELRDSDDTLIAEIDDHVGGAGEERAECVAAHTGVYGVVVKAAPGVPAAGAYTVRLAEVRPSTADDRALFDSRTLQTRAARLTADGRFDGARSLLERALALADGVPGRDEARVGAIGSQLGIVYRYLPDDAKSENAFLSALALMEKSLGADHPATAIARSHLALLYQKMGQRAKAETVLRQAMEAIEASLGPESRAYVSALITLGNLRHDGGDFDAEEKIIRRGLQLLEKNDDVESSLYSDLLNSLGEVYRARGDFATAESWYEKSLAVGVRALGEDSYFVAPVLQALGIMARERKDYATAEAYYARVLAIRERVVGTNHPDVAAVLNNLANIYRAKGALSRSLETHLRALSIWEHAAGPYQDATLLSVGNIARTYTAAGDVANAIAYQRRGDEILEKQLALNLAIGSERQKLLFVNGARDRTDRTISLSLAEGRDSPEASALAALVLLQRKGRVQDAMAETLAAIRQHTTSPADRALVDQLKTTTAELARLALSGSDAAHADQRQAAMKALESRKEEIEADLAARSAEFRAQVQPVTLAAVQQAIPDEAALLEFAVFRPFDAKAERNAESFGRPRYAAYVIRKQMPPRAFDLGPAAPIDEAVGALRDALRDPRRADVKQRARALDELALQPLRSAFSPLAPLLISPDGALNLVPFEALVDEQGRYAIERHPVTYLTSGRDLLRMQVPRGSRSGPAIFADPVFGEPPPPAGTGDGSAGTKALGNPMGGDGKDARSAAAAAKEARSSAGGSKSSRSLATGVDLASVYFPPLAATAEEARAIKLLFPDAVVFTGRRAQKATLQQVDAPLMLHVASHGFFLQDGRVGAENPLLRSGLALAGANLPHDREEEGILTALEASALNLWGTKLVTLSACDTGLGEVRNGEGVYGLRRAFVLAGTETLVMSLWPVSDAVARETMVAYYTGLRNGLGRGAALRASKLAMLRRPSRQHPFYWASFIQSGVWGPLDESTGTQ